MSEMEDLKNKLFRSKKTGWESIDDNRRNEINKFCDEYMYFLNNSKTEREIIKSAKQMADENGFKNIEECNELKEGDKVYYINREKSMYLAVIGKEPMENGINIIGAHADSPRLDLKPNPLYEDTGLAYFKTHYYGGIKKYQWPTIPLSMHGKIFLEDIKKKNAELKNKIKELEEEKSSLNYKLIESNQRIKRLETDYNVNNKENGVLRQISGCAICVRDILDQVARLGGRSFRKPS